MTEDEHIKLVEVGNDFYDDFSAIIAKHLMRLPESIRDEAKAYLQDKCSLYGSDYESHMRTGK